MFIARHSTLQNKTSIHSCLCSKGAKNAVSQIINVASVAAARAVVEADGDRKITVCECAKRLDGASESFKRGFLANLVLAEDRVATK